MSDLFFALLLASRLLEELVYCLSAIRELCCIFFAWEGSVSIAFLVLEDNAELLLVLLLFLDCLIFAVLLLLRLILFGLTLVQWLLWRIPLLLVL